MKGVYLSRTLGLLTSMMCTFLALAVIVAWMMPVSGLMAQTHTNSTQKDQPDWISPPAFSYTAQGRVDPFASFLHSPDNARSQDQAADSSLSPLQQVAPSQLQLVGIMHPQDHTSRIALVELPNGKGYILKPGTPIGRNQGVVTIISPHQVTIQETKTTPWGQEIPHSVVLELHASGDGHDN